MVRYLIGFAGLVMLCGIVWNALSDALANSAPVQAVLIDPWNEKAALAILKSKIAKIADDQTARRTVLDTSMAAAVGNPIESRFPSAAAVAYLYDNRPERGVELASSALKLDSTDHFAANIVARHHVVSGDVDGAIDVLSRALRRNPSNAVTMVELLRVVVETKKGRTAFARILQEEAGWALPAIRALADQDNGYEIVYDILSAREIEADERYGQIDRAIAYQFIKQGRFALGFRHFLQQVPESRPVSYVFNADFAYEPLLSPWDWRLKSTSGATVQRLAGEETRVQITFRDRPVNAVGLSQYVAIPPGALDFSTEIRSSAFAARKPLELRLSCLEPKRSQLASIEVPSGSYSWQRLQVSVDNSTAACRYGFINLVGTGVRGSFRDRYTGVVELRTVELTRLQN
ncbi:tetratricopeptide repeat protein [Notoacmeibacter marinus]|uniref:tetratricopeptide repeat protein n=1 Tax=Notoacmeibacter marinus TaxID=1876515 RepID=UPI00117B1327|nr:hypothetical protein [Notoacmeibacter marinus]